VDFYCNMWVIYYKNGIDKRTYPTLIFDKSNLICMSNRQLQCRQSPSDFDDAKHIFHKHEQDQISDSDKYHDDHTSSPTPIYLFNNFVC
jgi:hypothetical protein